MKTKKIQILMIIMIIPSIKQNLTIEQVLTPPPSYHQVDLPIHIHNGDTAIVTFTGVGFDKRALGDTMPLSDNHEVSGVPSVQSVPLPGQVGVIFSACRAFFF